MEATTSAVEFSESIVFFCFVFSLSAVSGKVPNAGDVSFSVGPTEGCLQSNCENTGSFMASESNVAPGFSG